MCFGLFEIKLINAILVEFLLNNGLNLLAKLSDLFLDVAKHRIRGITSTVAEDLAGCVDKASAVQNEERSRLYLMCRSTNEIYTFQTKNSDLSGRAHPAYLGKQAYGGFLTEVAIPVQSKNLQVLGDKLLIGMPELKALYSLELETFTPADDEDLDGDGYTSAEGDCNDHNKFLNPATVLYADADGDKFGNSGSWIVDCESTDGYVADKTDFDDADVNSYPGATEICDEKDNDGDGTVDEETEAVDWYLDADGDGYGDEDGAYVRTCVRADGYVTDHTDCDDDIGTTHPGAEDPCDDGVDNNCDGAEGIYGVECTGGIE